MSAKLGIDKTQSVLRDLFTTLDVANLRSQYGEIRHDFTAHDCTVKSVTQLRILRRKIGFMHRYVATDN